MTLKTIIKGISLISYAFIILRGHMIGIPFLFWLAYTSLEFGNHNQYFAIIGIAGFVLMLTKFHKNIYYRIFVFACLLTPILQRFSELPFEAFNYLSFQIPFVIFVISFLILIFKRFDSSKYIEKTQNT